MGEISNTINLGKLFLKVAIPQVFIAELKFYQFPNNS